MGSSELGQERRLPSSKLLLLTFGAGGEELEVEVDDPERTTLRDVFQHLAGEGRLPEGYRDLSQVFVVHGNERKPLDLDAPISRLGLPDSAVLKVLPRDIRVGGKEGIRVRERIPYKAYGGQVGVANRRERVVIPPRNPFRAMKLRLARELAELGFEPVSGGPDGEWLWRGPLCGTQAVIVIPKILDADNPASLWVPRSFAQGINWYRFLQEGELLGETYRKICIFPTDATLHNAILEVLVRIKQETGYECPELQGKGARKWRVRG